MKRALMGVVYIWLITGGVVGFGWVLIKFKPIYDAHPTVCVAVFLTTVGAFMGWMASFIDENLD